ncbi:MAG: adenylyltransferase/cytidyltransferase family protein [Candidatus Nanoarchaeia archaeon]|nr:adenylyltransferase/cytidyltransferase family protein [Candidatus Nanoarchaeia archaeon]MDD5587747.1 adenylyltransferase/cytidyltransferase family protein [Candidatus Nanoarchaeia archaeon]
MKKVLVWGTFDGLHKGHLEFLKNAKSLGDKLYIIIIPDKAVKENKGKYPIKNAEERKKELLKLKFVTEVYSGLYEENLKYILKLKPEVVIFGYDQKTKWEENLKKTLSSKGIFPEYIYLEEYNNGIHSSDLNK